MNLLSFAVGRPIVAVAVRVNEVVVAKHACQRAVYGRIVEYLAYGGDSGNQVVAGVALLIEKLFRLIPNVLVKFAGMPGLDRDIPIADEARAFAASVSLVMS